MNFVLNIINVIYWDANPGFSVWILNPRWYGLLFASGFIVGYLLMEQFFKWEKKDLKFLESLTIYMVVGTVIGARLGHCLFYEPAFYLSHPLEMLYIWKGGLASHGAIIGILIALWLAVKKHKNFKYIWVLDRIVIVTALAGSFIRIGNFFNSEIYGIQTNVPWAVVFQRVDNVPRHPVQLYEAICYLAIFFFLYFYYKKRKENTREGFLLGMFLILVFSARFIIELWKEHQAAFELPMGLDMGLVLSIPCIIAGFIIVLWSYRKGKAK
jgi:prolipoprotein diacylglyceryl transferase